MGDEDRDNRTRHLVLNREHVLDPAVVALGPAMSAGDGVGELHKDADPVASATNATLQNVAYAEFSSDLAYVYRLAPVLERGIAGDDEQLGEPRQLGDDIVGNAAAEIVLALVAIEVVE